MKCELFLDRYDLLADAEAGEPALEPDDLVSLRAHLRDCESCRGEAELARELARAVKALPAIEPATLAPRFPSRSRRNRRVWQGVARLMGVAAVIAFVALAALRRAESPKPGTEHTPEVPVAAAPALRAATAPDARRLVETARAEPGTRQDVLARLRVEPDLPPSFMALARAVRQQFETSHSRADLASMLDAALLLDTMDSLLRGAGNSELLLSPEYEKLFLTNGFWLGYTLFALGDFEAAKATLRDYISRIDAVEKEKGSLDQYTAIYRDFRAKEVLSFLETRAGKAAAVDFDLGDSWVSSKRLRLADCTGSVVAVVFRGIGDTRAAQFLAPLAAFCAERPEMRIVTISYYRDGSPPADQRATLERDLEGLGYDGPAGFDPDGEERRIFRAFQANVGSATFFILNQRGELVWFMPDPREVDVEFAETLLLRCAAG